MNPRIRATHKARLIVPAADRLCRVSRLGNLANQSDGFQPEGDIAQFCTADQVTPIVEATIVIENIRGNLEAYRRVRIWSHVSYDYATCATV